MTKAAYVKAGLALAILAATAIGPATAAEWWNPFKPRQKDESPVETMTPPAQVGEPQSAQPGQAPQQVGPSGGPIPLTGGAQTTSSGPAPLGAPQTTPASEAVTVAPVTDPLNRIDRLEQMVRQLNGAVEKLVFENKQLREDLKKLQDDSDVRFQALENGQRPPQQRSAGEPVPGRRDFGAADLDAPAAAPPKETASAAPAPVTAPAPTTTASLDPIESAVAGAQLGAPPAPLGTLTIDSTSPGGAQVVGSTMAEPAAAPAAGVAPINLSSLNPANPAGSADPAETPAPDPSAAAPSVAPSRSQVAAISPSQLTGSPTDVYNRAYQSVLDGDYEKAEQGFRAFLVAFPTDKRAPDAQYWIGDSLYQRGLFRDAGREFNTGYRAYPKSPKAADSLLRLGMSLNALGQREAACSVYSELTKRYPSAPFALLQKLKTEQASASC
jgi:tol-pal system protein YbgF